MLAIPLGLVGAVAYGKAQLLNVMAIGNEAAAALGGAELTEPACIQARRAAPVPLEWSAASASRTTSLFS